MDAYVCPKSVVPDKLYRVHYPGSRTTFASSEGFSASDTSKVYSNDKLSDFKQDIVNQFTWSCRKSLPFISLFSDREHAENWGCKEPWHGHQDDGWSLYVIDATRLKDTNRLFKLSDLLEELNLQIPAPAGRQIHGAYLCLHHIPVEAIIEKKSPSEVKAGKYEQRFAEGVNSDYLEEYSGSEREAMQENYNTIFEKNIENNW
ncbi:hypothetical protein DM02DRAFT_722078 [Periconia macrospinosa]|uniref:DUF7587 domain-containing protein n=1 Tax=Periconia macrospinosa TaxID=97972 RepID=A0A2V1D380_9PLEO|nr:hypothetical protein DM02DRAFT_722078 [Periconia macrospinosa]